MYFDRTVLGNLIQEKPTPTFLSTYKVLQQVNCMLCNPVGAMVLTQWRLHTKNPEDFLEPIVRSGAQRRLLYAEERLDFLNVLLLLVCPRLVGKGLTDDIVFDTEPRKA